MKLFQIILELHLVIQEKEKGFLGSAMVKNPPANAGDEIRVRSLGQEDLLEKGTATPVFLPGKSHGQRSLVGYSP